MASLGVRTLIVGVVAFMLLAPLLAVARQATILGFASVLGAATELSEGHLLPLLPVDPVYGGAGLRILGGIKPVGLAIAGPPGALLYQLLPGLFLAPELTAPGAAVSAVVGDGVTVLARLMTALLATSVLLALSTVLSGRARWRRDAAPGVALRLAQIWLLLDLGHEADLTVRDLEATGLPFALAALAPVDANGQRVLLTTHLDALPDPLIGLMSAGLAIGACLMLALVLRGIGPAAMALWRLGTAGHGSDRRWWQAADISERMARWRSRCMPRLTVNRHALVPRGSFLLILFALVLSVSPYRSLAEGETAIAVAAFTVDTAADADDAVAGEAPDIADDSAASVTEGVAGIQPALDPAADASPAPDGEPPIADATVPVTQAAGSGPRGSGSLVSVEGGGYQYTLLVDGQPTVVRGMGYNPWYADLPAEERRLLYRRDFSAMREAGVNTLEGWFESQFDEITLDEAHRHDLKVIMPFELNHDYDYGDPATRAMFREQVTAWVLRYRDHPAVLMWGPGNEVMHRLIFPSAVQGQRDPAREKRADDFAAFYVELIDLIHQLDPDHPIVYRDAEDLYFARLRQALLKDGQRRSWFVYGTNVYTQRLAEVIERWPEQGVDAPLLVSEFSPGGVGPAERPSMLGWYWSTIRAHPKRVIGGVVYTWATRGPEDLDRIFGLTDESGAPVDGSLAALRRLFRGDLTGRSGPSGRSRP